MDEQKIFLEGIEKFNKKNFYGAHECWEEIWTEINIPDDKFIQGLIQLSVAYFHISNQNIVGAKSLFNKSINKLIDYIPLHRGLDIKLIVEKAKQSLEILITNNSTEKFNWKIVPILIIKND